MGPSDVDVTINNLYDNSGSKKAVASVELFQVWATHDITVLQGSDGKLKIQLPNRQDFKREGKKIDISHPTKAYAREIVESAILDEYIRVRRLIEALADHHQLDQEQMRLREKYNKMLSRQSVV